MSFALAPRPQIDADAAPLDRFLPCWDVRGRHSTIIHAPAAVVLAVARELDMQSLPLVRGIFRLREWFLGSRPAARVARGMVAETQALGWGCLEDDPDRCYLAGASCQPWLADVVFVPIARERFARYAEPDRVKIAWTLEVEPLDAGRCRFSTETRAVSTDERARGKFLRYWRVARVGIVAIRLLLLPALRREAERRWRRQD